MSLKLKVYYNNDFKVFNMKKTDTLQELALKVIEDFGIEGVDLENFRLRGYDPKLNAKLAIYDQYGEKLMRLSLYNYFMLTVETKRADEKFEEYDPNTVYLRAIKYVEGDEYNFGKTETLPTTIITVNKKNETVTDLDNKLSELFGIPTDRLVVFLRHD